MPRVPLHSSTSDAVAHMAERQGLALAFRRFPADIIAAAEDAAKYVEELKAPRDPQVEPWPAMRVPGYD